MQLSICHLTTYRYSREVPYEIQTLRLTPRSYDGLVVTSWSVRGDRNRPLPSFIDGLGNVVHNNAINRPHEGAIIAVAGTVETHAAGGLVTDARDRLPPAYFLRPTGLAAADETIAAFARESARGARPRERLMALMEAIAERITYRRGSTHAATTAAEALALGEGVCQDHAHVFIAACRSLGVPARYVGGYFWPGENRADDQASHAWAEAFVEDAGWIGFDPANRTVQDERHVRISVGLDYASSAPIRGIRRGIAEETLSVACDVAAPQAQQ
jgi:transglutaminase-like putative cysteine protease